MYEDNWTVLLVGGSSGIGKSELTKALLNKYNAKVIEADDLCCAVNAMTTSENYPAINYWFGDEDWELISIQENVDWLCKVSGELESGLRAIINNHINQNNRVIIEGDFISAEFAASFDEKVKSIFIHEAVKTNIIENYLNREGGESQEFRASISHEYGNRLKRDCQKYGLRLVSSRPFSTLLERAIAHIEDSSTDI